MHTASLQLWLPCVDSENYISLKFSPSLQIRTLDTDDPQSEQEMHAEEQRFRRKAIFGEKCLTST